MTLYDQYLETGAFFSKHRGSLPIIVLIAGLIVYVINETHRTYELSIISKINYERLCLSISLAGLFIRIITVGFTYKNTSGRETDGLVAERLNTTGMYSVVRHPLYFGNFLMWLGLAFMTQNFWFIIILTSVFTLFYERIMLYEEQFLKDKYQNDFIDWSKRTPTFIPSLKNWKSPNTKFHLLRVLRREKNGLLGAFSSFLLYQMTADFFIYGKFEIRDWVVLGGFIASALFYLLIKALQKTTTIFVE